MEADPPLYSDKSAAAIDVAHALFKNIHNFLCSINVNLTRKHDLLSYQVPCEVTDLCILVSTFVHCC